jgi:hypothetical protein
VAIPGATATTARMALIGGTASDESYDVVSKSKRMNFPAPPNVVVEEEVVTMRSSDRAWVALASGVAAYDLIATDDELLTNAARRYFKSQPIATVSTILVTGLHLVGGLPPWCDPITLTFAGYRRLLRGSWFSSGNMLT